MTVLVFGNGAVIRLASSVAAGQLLFLTNEKTKKEVVCQVVKSKNYKNVSGYVELEFTEAIPGFWGMRFPGDHPAAQPKAAAPAAIAKPVAPAPAPAKADSPAANTIPQRVESKVAPPAPAASSTTTSALHAEKKPSLNLPHTADGKTVTTAPHSGSQTQPPQPHVVAPRIILSNASLPKAPGLTDGFGLGLTSTARPAESKTTPSPAGPKASQTPVATPSSSDALRRESERLQEQLASMLFAAEIPATPVRSAPVPPAVKPPTSELSAKVVEIAKSQILAAKAPPKVTPVRPHSTLDDEQVQIPSWLEPLARNAATQAHNENIAKDVPVSAYKVIEFEVQDVSAPAIAEPEEVPASAEASRGIHAEEVAQTREQSGSQGKNKGLLIGAIAAGLLVAAAGGTWYVRHSAAPVQEIPAATAAAVAPGTPQLATRVPEKSAVTPNRSNINSEPVAKLPAQTSSPASSPSAPPEAQLVKAVPEKTTAAELSEYKKLAEPIIQPTKKPGLGQVHLSAPKAGRTVAPDFENADAGMALSAGQVAPVGDSFGGGLLPGSSKQPVAPAAPLPIGGDVKAARLLSAVPPAYPTLAKTQRIQGAVQVDALVDTNGKVSSMKIVSGPPLLHQAAMDALRQWKYQPATLDGKPVPMHLTVTVQFRLQ
jgi:protein TonB